MKKLVLSIILASLAACCYAANLEDIRTAVRGEYIAAYSGRGMIDGITQPDESGKWPDIDYNDDSRAQWQLEKHLDRLISMAGAYMTGNRTDRNLFNSILRALNQWFEGGYENDNWWYTKIGIPRRMLTLAYLLDGELPEDLTSKLNKSLDAIDSDDFPARPGGDRIQVLTNHAKVLLWRRDNKRITDIFKKIEKEARIAPFEETMYDAGGGPAVRNNWRPSGRGVQADMSFHHRGDRVDSTLTYGLELPLFFSYWAELLKDSEWAFSNSAINFIIDYYLDGVCRHIVGGRYVEPSIMNRELSRPGEGRISPDIINSLQSISGGYRENELENIAAALNGKSVENKPYAVYFSESDYFTYSRPGFQTAVRFHSERNANQEAPHNNEGIRNHFRGDGACMLSVTGREYADIAPLFDFRKIPGATTPLLPYEPLSNWGPVQILDSPVSFAGAITDSIYGAVAFNFMSGRSDLKARKGYFFFDEEYLCLGSGINSSATDEIVTTVEQTWSPSNKLIKDNDRFIHEGHTYHIIEGEATGSLERRSGTWRNCVENVEYADSVAEGDIFTLTISHGISPRDAKYAYAVTPGKKLIGKHSFEIIANETTHQAVMSADGSLLYIIFYEPSSVVTPLGTFGAEQSCMIMLKDRNRLYAADPTRHSPFLIIHTPGATKKIKTINGKTETLNIDKLPK